MSLIISSSALMYQGHPVPDGWNVTFHNETTIEMTDGNSTIGLYNITVPKEVTDWIGGGIESPMMDMTLVRNFIKDKEIKLESDDGSELGPVCRSFTTNQVFNPFGTDTISMAFCDNGNYFITWKTPEMENDYTCLYAKFRGGYNITTLQGYNLEETMPSVLYEYLS